MEYNAQTIIFANKVVIKKKKKKKKKKINEQIQKDTMIIEKPIMPNIQKIIIDENFPICMYGVPPIQNDWVGQSWTGNAGFGLEPKIT